MIGPISDDDLKGCAGIMIGAGIGLMIWGVIGMIVLWLFG